MTKEYTVKPFTFPEDDKKVILEYFVVKYTRQSMLSKTYVVDFEPKSHEECPVRLINEFDTVEALHPAPELAMVPVAMCRDPFRIGKHKLVLCEFAYPDQRNKDVDINSEMVIGDHIGFERQFVDLHLRACIYAGLEMYGCVREMNPSQWEFQVGPLPGIQTADHVIIARYILLRLAEIHDIKISFRNIDCARGTNARQTFHLNFSTKKSRADGGIKHLYEIIENISKYPQEALFKYYDVSNGEEMKWYLDGDFYMPLYDEFKHTIGDKHQSSVRIPTHVASEGKGYIEDRRPVSDADPYDVCRAFIVAALFDHKGKVLI